MYDTLKQQINDTIKANGKRQITGTNLNQVLNAIVSELGEEGASLGGFVTPSQEISESEGNIFYIASKAGTYTNFDDIVVGANEIAFLYKANGEWTKASVPTYVKPSNGIPSTDLDSSVQTSLGKADTALQQEDIAEIESVIPAEADKDNKLADKNYVDTNISTASATFRGTSAADLTEQQFIAWANALTKDNNDYVFWNTVDSDGDEIYKRYKWDGTQWSYEFTLSNTDKAILYKEQNLTDTQRNTALANVSNQTANSITGKMGYKVLDPTKTFAEQVTAENTIYEIRDVFDLGGTQETPVSITLPAGSTLKFNGGKIKNCTINSDYVDIEANKEKIFDNVKFTGYCTKQFFKIEWFVDVCTNKVLSNTNLCAASQFEEALNSGIMNLTIGRDRYYPLQRTIDYTGTANIFAESDYNLRGYRESRIDNYHFPCIYSNTVVTLIDYKFKDTATSGRYTQSLYLQGLFLLVNKPYTDLSEKDVPILKITAKTDIWGLTIDSCIRGTDRVVVVNTEGQGHYIDSATVDSTYLPNYTGIELVTNGGYMTNVTINGSIGSIYRGVKATRGSSSAEWMTVMNFNASTTCAIGADLGSNFNPLIVTGQHQTIRCFSATDYLNSSYFTCDGIDNQGFVYDIGVSSNGIYAAGTALRVIHNNSSAIILNGLQAEKATVDYPIYESRIDYYTKRNNGIDLASKSINLLHQSLNANLNICLSTVSYKVTCEGSTINMFNWGIAENTFMTLVNQNNIFAPNFDVFSTSIASNLSRTNLGYGRTKEAYYNKTFSFAVHIEGDFNRVGHPYESGVLMLRFPLACNDITVVINGNTKNISSSIFYYNNSIFVQNIGSSFNIDITWTYTDSSNHFIILPFIYIPYIHSTKYQFYDGWSFPKGNTFPFFFRSTNTDDSTYKRPAFCLGNNMYDGDGFKHAIKTGTTAQRPASASEGYQYYDSDLKKYILWNGTDWVNLDGTALS